MELIVVVCGDRRWRDEATIRARLTRLRDRAEAAGIPRADILIVHGDNGNERALVGGRGQQGADRIAGRVATDLGMAVRAMPAHWEHAAACPAGCRHWVGPAAGPQRNRAMLDLTPRQVVAFHRAIEFSKGTKDCVSEARRRGIPVDIVTELSHGV